MQTMGSGNKNITIEINLNIIIQKAQNIKRLLNKNQYYTGIQPKDMCMESL